MGVESPSLMGVESPSLMGVETPILMGVESPSLMGVENPKQVRKLEARPNPYREASQGSEQDREEINPYSQEALLQEERRQKEFYIQEQLKKSPTYKPAQYYRIALRESQPYPQPPSPRSIQFEKEKEEEMNSDLWGQMKEALIRERRARGKFELEMEQGFDEEDLALAEQLQTQEENRRKREAEWARQDLQRQIEEDIRTTEESSAGEDAKQDDAKENKAEEETLFTPYKQKCMTHHKNNQEEKAKHTDWAVKTEITEDEHEDQDKKMDHQDTQESTDDLGHLVDTSPNGGADWPEAMSEETTAQRNNDSATEEEKEEGRAEI